MVFNLFHVSMLFGMMWVILTASGEQISYWLVGGLWTFVYFVTLLPVSINGLGVQEISAAYVFVQFGGVEEGNALLLALLVRLLMMMLSLPGALFVNDLIPDLLHKQKINKVGD